MSTIVLILALVLVCLIAAGLYLWFKARNPSALAHALPFIKPAHRKLTDEERAAVEFYLNQQNKLSNKLLPGGGSTLPAAKLALTPQSDNVYPVTHAITRYGLASDDPNKWRYYLDAEEVHLPPFWEPYITADNHVEVIRTQTLPLVISLNGHSLKDHIHDRPQPPVVSAAPTKNASIRKEESEHVELVNIRKETPEEHALNRPNGIREAVIISVALLLLFFSLISPVLVIPWMIFVAVLMIAWGCWNLFRRPASRELKEIHCLRGTPKRWGLFGESGQGQISNISLGIIDLIYPPHWQPYLTQDLGKTTDVDVYLNRQVVRQGRFLSLHDEVKNFPLQQWGRNAVLAASSALVLLLLLIYIPLNLPLTLSMAWLQGAQKVEVTSVQALEATPLRIGDTLKVRGSGMCYVPPPANGGGAANFAPFDCSGIYWNNAAPLPQPESEVIDKATALLATVNSQLHPSGADQKVNPQLASAIEKSGMILLDDFSDIVLKTQDLCQAENDCVRLKNALVNLGNAKNWSGLVKRARSGALQGVNVLLRPVSAESLDSLTKVATSSFIFNETRLAAAALNSPPPGGFLIRSDEGRQLVSHPQSSAPQSEYNALDQWNELQRLSTLLLHTPFHAQGVITSLSVDANGTRHVALHSEPDMITLWRYLGTSLLLLAVVISLGYNAWRLVQRRRINQHRVADIQRYYDSCFNPQLNPMSMRPMA
ncbi:TPA: intracellular growth attenuator family protein [Serratia marcescens]|uniref:Intracellular growth attenuator membrane protein n=1 Tax=Serratia marcescens SM39 TaxID=1334564 RepID=A0AAT9F3G8_SERMA|nr:intracellular growth attenuator family protein [Serratia marcescens]BAO36002.1 intracellular growth attenuator membrane protein [Serratia marcescens SM39]BCZ43544.1 intracellular growth attenuator protein IgaA [Serratia marcescens]HBI6268735.1 intracellular growth attenuator family protein [Serratia marcescens]HBI6951189.1 intracellular growth attenuator family protein [Serratia marcescens]HBI6959601.1 intracellular growth attenuator family protein [Serratia marcescens]